MKLIDNKLYALIEDFFAPEIIAGFTTSNRETNFAPDFKKVLPFSRKELSFSYMNQLHSGRILTIEEPSQYSCDGIFTKGTGHALVVKTADCLPLIFSDSSKGIIGVVHMGWCGARDSILNNIPYDLSSFKVLAGVGLRRCCYEVGEELLDSSLAGYLSKKDSKFYFDPIGFAEDKLYSQGLVHENFFDLGVCSFCSGQKHLSYRKTKTKKRMLSFIFR